LQAQIGSQVKIWEERKGSDAALPAFAWTMAATITDFRAEVRRPCNSPPLRCLMINISTGFVF
jgi:hypothetical protein